MRRLVERGLPELVMAGITEHQKVPHAPAALGCFPGRRADARFLPNLRHARPQPVTKWTAFRLVIEQIYMDKMIMPSLTIFSQLMGLCVVPATSRPSWRASSTAVLRPRFAATRMAMSFGRRSASLSA
jgi:hypothetical protein